MISLRSYMRPTIIFILSGLTSCAPVWADEDDACHDVLRDTVFNTTVFKTSLSDNDYFRKWQCSRDFGNHQEALNAGLDIDTVVYGVPLKVGGTFDSNEKDSWKKQNCSESEKASNLDTATYQLIRSVSPELVAAWATCMAQRRPTGLSCDISPPGRTVVFHANWNRVTGETEGAQPIVAYFSTVGGACQRQLRRGDKINEAGATIVCTPGEDVDLTIALDTQRGSCFKVSQSQQTAVQISGSVKLDKPRFVKADIIEFTDGAEIVTNGYALTIEAKEIKLNGVPRLVSFTSPADSGKSGVPAGPITIAARKISGTELLIANHGQDGAAGIKGDIGPQGPQGTQGSQAMWNLLKGCYNRTESGPGGSGVVGGPGYPGKPGGPGGLVNVLIKEGVIVGNVSRISVEKQRTNPQTNAVKTCTGSCGGFGGQGGEGGDGGPGGAGGPAVPPTDVCGGSGAGPVGPGGPSGQRGPVGSDGPDGYIGINAALIATPVDTTFRLNLQ